MATIVTRSGKGSPLTNNEVDANFTNLNTGKAELSGAVFTGAITTNSTIDGRDVAADGVTADAALPKSGGAMTGAITTNSTFDGRDVATDGTKLDGIEASATADQTGAQIKAAYEAQTNAFTDAQFTKLGGIEASATADQTAAEIRALVESATDSNVFTDADHTKLNGIEASADVTDTANVTAAGALMDSELTAIASVKALNQGVATGDSPTFAGLTTTSNVSITGGSYASVSAGSGRMYGSSVHGLVLQGSGTTRDFLLLDKNGDDRVYINSTGISVTGTATMDGLTVDASSAVVQSATGTASPTPTTFNISTTSSASDWTTTSPWGRLAFYSGDTSGSGGKPHVVLDATASNAIGASSSFSVSTTSESANTLTERMRIDSSGNVLVGKTGLDTTVAGAEIRPNLTAITSAGDAPLYLRRNTNDGELISFKKDGTTVGSIGVAAGDNIYFAGASGSTKGIYINNAAVYPADTGGAVIDNAVALGQSGARWTDLYLSGGVYLGGTGAANKLDDYEEGTWTPVTGPTSTTATYAFRSGYYTKVGNLVTCTFGLKHNGGVWTSGEATISGLPFTVDTTGSYQEPQFIVTSVGLLPTGKGGSAAGGAFNTGEVSFYCSGTQGRGRSYVSNSDTVMGGNAVFATNSFIKATIIYHSS